MKKTENIVIWGAGVVGRAVYEELQQYPEIQVAAFGDNSVQKQGTACCGKPVLSLAQVAARGDISAVFLGIKANNQELAPQLEKALGIPVYSDFQALIHRFLCARISIDITGWCNARCTWCTTGRKNRDGITRGGVYAPGAISTDLPSFKGHWSHLSQQRDPFVRLGRAVLES